MQNRNRAKAPKGSFLHAADGRNKRLPLFSRFLARRGTMANASQERESSSLLDIPNSLFEPYQNSSEATSVLRFHYYHLCTATVPQRQHSTGIIFRPYQRRSVIFPDNEQALFPGPNRLRQKNQDHPVRFGTGRLYHLSTEDDKRLSQERVFRHEFGSATNEARDVIGCSQGPYLAVRCHK